VTRFAVASLAVVALALTGCGGGGPQKISRRAAEQGAANARYAVEHSRAQPWKIRAVRSPTGRALLVDDDVLAHRLGPFNPASRSMLPTAPTRR
jgi:hypothetical protein